MSAVDFAYRPLAIHADFHRSTAEERMLFGAMGSGKSYAIIAEAIAWALEQPGIKGIVIRKTFPELRDTTVPIFKELMPTELWEMCETRSSNGCLSEVVFPNGSIVYFRSMEDWNKHRSFNIGFLCYDECNEIDLESYRGMIFRSRQTELTAEARDKGYTHKITRRGIWGATNPAGRDWLWRRFVDQGGVDYQEGTAWFRSTTLDNPYLPVTTVQNWLTMPEQWVKRYVLCQFDDFAGSVFANWNEADHKILRAELPEKWRLGDVFWMGFDPGTRDPTAAVWAWLDRVKKRLVVVGNYEQNYTAATTHMAEFRKIEATFAPGTVKKRIADPNVNTTERAMGNMTLQDIYRRGRFHFEFGPRQPKDRIPALQQMIELRQFVVVEGLGDQTFDDIKNHKWEDMTSAAKTKGGSAPERPLKDDHSHLVDCSEYLASRFVKPLRLQTIDPDVSEWEHFSNEAKKSITRQNKRKRHSNGRQKNDLWV